MSKKDIMTDPILRKGHGHQTKKEAYRPEVCPKCRGYGYFSITNDNGEPKGATYCSYCAGMGELG